MLTKTIAPGCPETKNYFYFPPEALKNKMILTHKQFKGNARHFDLIQFV